MIADMLEQGQNTCWLKQNQSKSWMHMIGENVVVHREYENILNWMCSLKRVWKQVQGRDNPFGCLFGVLELSLLMFHWKLHIGGFSYINYFSDVDKRGHLIILFLPLLLSLLFQVIAVMFFTPIF